MDGMVVVQGDGGEIIRMVFAGKIGYAWDEKAGAPVLRVWDAQRTVMVPLERLYYFELIDSRAVAEN